VSDRAHVTMAEEEKGEEKDWQKKAREFEQVKARAKALRLRLTCVICGEKAKLNCPCETTQYCTVACQKVDWRDRGHRKACKKIRDERAAEAARAEAPKPPPSPPREVFYGPAPRSHADEVRARIAAEHEAARARREANPEPEPVSARYGPRCPICLEEWDVNAKHMFLVCCCRRVCESCSDKIRLKLCPLCRLPCAENNAEHLARLRRHVENEVPEAITSLGNAYSNGRLGLVKSDKKAAKLYKRAVERGNVEAMCSLAVMYMHGEGVKHNKNKAIQLMRMAADRGVAEAQKMVAGAFDEAGDDQEAVRYMTLAGEQGLTEAETALGHLYAGGLDGVEVDFQEAKRWFARAAAKGDEEAKQALARNAHIFGA